MQSLFVSTYQISDLLCSDMTFFSFHGRTETFNTACVHEQTECNKTKGLFTEQLNSCGKDVACWESWGEGGRSV